MRSPENPLERMLRDLGRQPELHPASYQRLLVSEVIVPVQVSAEHLPHRKIPAQSLVQVITQVRADGVGVIPFFTSPERLFLWSPTGERCVMMFVRELFESRPDMQFCLNLGSHDEQQFTPSQVQALLAYR